MPQRVLILTASIGEGHDLPARMLADQIRAESPGAEVVTRDGLVAMGRVFTTLNEDAARVIFHRLQWVWDVAFWIFVRFAPTRRLTQFLISLVGARGIARLVRDVDPDV